MFDYYIKGNIKSKQQFINKLKTELKYKLLLLKGVLLVLLIYLFFFPLYDSLFILFNNKLSSTISGITINNDFLFFIFLVLLFLLVVRFLISGSLPFSNYISLSAVLMLILFDTDYLLFPLKAILIFFMYKLPKTLYKFQIAYDNYSSYSKTYYELSRLKNVFDLTLKNQIMSGVLLICLSYIFLIIFSLFRLEIGLNTAILLAIIILPILTIYLFNSSEIFKSLDKLEVE